MVNRLSSELEFMQRRELAEVLGKRGQQVVLDITPQPLRKLTNGLWHRGQLICKFETQTAAAPWPGQRIRATWPTDRPRVLIAAAP